MSCLVNLLWDQEAAVWVATSEDVPGLALESSSFDALVERVRIAVPELLALNGSKGNVTLTLQSQWQEMLAV